MFIFHSFILLILLSLLVLLILNTLTVNRTSVHKTPESFPLVSVLVPARNEEENIERCINSLCKQSYSNYELIVYDDRSADRTVDVLEQLSQKFSNLKIIKGQELPKGWLGKCFACHQLAKEASGEFYLFTDADTEHNKDSVQASIAEIQHKNVGLLSLLPSVQRKSFWEKLFMPLLYFVEYTFLPFFLIRKLKNPKLSMGNGQFMLFSRKAYEAIGGHESVKDKLVEDVSLARKIKKHGLGLEIQDGFNLVNCRMYRNFKEIVEGFTKNIFPGLGYSVVGLIFLISFCFLIYIYPYIALTLGFVFSLDPVNWIYLPLIQVSVALMMRFILAYRFSLGWLSCFLHLPAISLFILIALNSSRMFLFGPGASWKGRRYPKTI